MKSILVILLIVLFVFSCSNKKEEALPEPLGSNNIAYQWGKVSLECTANDTERFKPRPTVTSRILALIWTSVFDAWSRYDDKATPLYLTIDRQAESKRTLKNKEIAISYAAYRSMLEYYFSDSIFNKSLLFKII